MLCNGSLTQQEGDGGDVVVPSSEVQRRVVPPPVVVHLRACRGRYITICTCIRKQRLLERTSVVAFQQVIDANMRVSRMKRSQ